MTANYKQNRGSVSFWVILQRISIILFVVCIIAILGYKFISQYRRYREVCRQKKERMVEIRRKEIAIQELRNNTIRLDTCPAFAERIAREEGRITPDESMVRSTNPPLFNAETTTPRGHR